MKTISPTPALPQGEGVANKMNRFHKSRRYNTTPSLEGRAGVGLPSLWGRVGVGLLCLILCGCITEYDTTGIDELGDILVVEGIITDDISYITLSRSVNLSNEENSQTSKQYVYNAKVYVECDDNTLLVGYFDYDNFRYVINTGILNLERKYSLKIEIEEPDYNSADCQMGWWGEMICPTITHEYSSDPSYPIQTPEIDSVFWKKRGKGQPVMIYVATHDQEGKVQYFRWSYKEDWEYHSTVFLDGYPFYCWNSDSNREMLLGNTEKTVFGKKNDVVTEIVSSDRRLSYLYRINVKQNVISKRAYDYYDNIKKNAKQTGSIFSPIPSELRGNIKCITDPGRPVIGYVDVSTTTKNQRYIYYNEVYEYYKQWDCTEVPEDTLQARYNGIPYEYVLFNPWVIPKTYILVDCVDCTLNGGGDTQKPGDWPNNH